MRVHISVVLSLVFYLFFTSSPLLHAQSSEAGISARLVGKPLFLRGFWAEDKLKFDGSGNPEGPFSAASFTVSGIKVNVIHLKSKTLRIEGIREGLEFDEKGGMHRVELRVGKFTGQKPEKIEIEIDAPGRPGFDRALDAIFADKLIDLIPSMPEFWQRYAHISLLARNGAAYRPEVAPDANTRERAVQERGTMHVGGSVKPPKLSYGKEPVFSEPARRMRYSGKVNVYCWVDPLGIPSHVSVAKAAGLGLDEQAVDAVSKYRFFPASKDGQPVTVDIYIDVDFKVF